MNIALPTLIVLFFLIPGAIFIRFYFSGPFSKEFRRSTFFGFFSLVSFYGLILQIFWARVAPPIYNLQINFEHIGYLLVGFNDNSDKIGDVFNSIRNNLKYILLYNISLFTFSAIVGYLTKFIIRKLKLDRKIKLLRFKNHWHYVFTGEFLDFPKVKGHYNDIDIRVVDALVSSTHGDILYSGILIDYELHKDGTLNFIYLRHTKRRYLSIDKDEEEYKKIKSTYYYLPELSYTILKYNEVINLNISYYRIERATQLSQNSSNTNAFNEPSKQNEIFDYDSVDSLEANTNTLEKDEENKIVTEDVPEASNESQDSSNEKRDDSDLSSKSMS